MTSLSSAGVDILFLTMGTCFDAATICGESQLESSVVVLCAVRMVTYFDDCEVSKRVILQNLNVLVAGRAKLWVESGVFRPNLTLSAEWSKLKRS